MGPAIGSPIHIPPSTFCLPEPGSPGRQWNCALPLIRPTQVNLRVFFPRPLAELPAALFVHPVGF
jgi:hypothetical protein